MYHKFNIQQFYVLPTQYIYVFCMDLRTNSDYFRLLDQWHHCLLVSSCESGKCWRHCLWVSDDCGYLSCRWRQWIPPKL